MPDPNPSGFPPGPPSPNAPPAPWMPSGPMPHRNPMDMMPMMAFWGRAVGFLLLFVGTLVAVAFGTPGGGCYVQNPDCGAGSSFLTGAANAFLAAKVLWTIGLFALGAGAGIRMHWGLTQPTSGRPEDVTYVVSVRRFNGILLGVCILLLWLLLVGVPGSYLLPFLP